MAERRYTVWRGFYVVVGHDIDAPSAELAEKKTLEAISPGRVRAALETGLTPLKVDEVVDNHDIEVRMDGNEVRVVSDGKVDFDLEKE